MAKKKKTKSASQKKKSAVKVETWVDRLDFVPIEHDSINDSSTTRIRIVSWNILAESYLTPRSHRGLPRLYRNCVFSPRARRAVLHKRLEHFYDLNVDILCLQEVDMPLEILEECGYDSILTPTAREGNGTGGRVDACGIYFQRSKYKSCGHELIRLDDLATLGQTATTLPISNLQGLSTSFLRRNVALVCRLQHIESNNTIVVANAHCYWNPEYSYVKLCQVHYVMKRAHEFCKEGEGVVFCGDLNSPPHSSVYEYLSKGKVNAKLVAPWYQHSIEQDEEKNFLPGEKDIHQVEDELADLSITAKEEEKENDTSPQIRYMLDFTLNRFTRWLRILGIDAALETEEEEIQRTRENNMYVMSLCIVLVLGLCIMRCGHSAWHSHVLPILSL
jgi:mRNA deadenylase 3'-5' endonuclease subunit Ccr4